MFLNSCLHQLFRDKIVFKIGNNRKFIFFLEWNMERYCIPGHYIVLSDRRKCIPF